MYTGDTTMKGRYNTGIVSINTKGWYGESIVWLNTKAIATLLSIPMLEEAGYLVSTHTKGDSFFTPHNREKNSPSVGRQKCVLVCHTSINKKIRRG